MIRMSFCAHDSGSIHNGLRIRIQGCEHELNVGGRLRVMERGPDREVSEIINVKYFLVKAWSRKIPLAEDVESLTVCPEHNFLLVSYESKVSSHAKWRRPSFSFHLSRQRFGY